MDNDDRGWTYLGITVVLVGLGLAVLFGGWYALAGPAASTIVRTALQVVPPAALVIVTAALLDSNQAMADVTEDMAAASGDMAKANEDLANIESFRVYPDLQSRGIEWMEPDSHNTNLRIWVVNVGGHRTAIEAVRLVDKATDAVTEYELYHPDDSDHDPPPKMNVVVESGEIQEIRAVAAQIDGRDARRSDFKDPKLEVVPVVGEVDPQGIEASPDKGGGWEVRSR